VENGDLEKKGVTAAKLEGMKVNSKSKKKEEG